jgi:ribonuclease PH
LTIAAGAWGFVRQGVALLWFGLHRGGGFRQRKPVPRPALQGASERERTAKAQGAQAKDHDTIVEHAQKRGDRHLMRSNGRDFEALREVQVELDYTKHAEGSALIIIGDTGVLCTCTVEDRVPPFLNDANQGWVTAEYGMLPRSTNTRTPREAARGKQSGRTVEIQRLIGRALRSVVHMPLLGRRTLLIDCDVLQADGGTRTASITGGFIALTLAVGNLMKRRLLEFSPLVDFVAATSVGVIQQVPCLDLDYNEDYKAEVDMNLVMTGKGQYVEIQGTAEKQSFSGDQLQALLALGAKGIAELVQKQRSVLEERVDLKRLLPNHPLIATTGQ